MPDMIHQTITISRRVAELAVAALARAEVEGAFKDCAVPGIGRMVRERLELELREQLK